MEWWQLQQLLVTIAVIVGVLIPVCALSYRFLAGPFGSDRRRLAGDKEALASGLQDQRLDHMERQLEELDGMVRRLVDASEFDRQLKSGKPSDEDA
jgi:hypothetical protein